MFFSPKFFHFKEVKLPQAPQEFVAKLIEWVTDASHENSSLVLGKDVIQNMKCWALSFYNDSCLCVVLRECVIVGNYVTFNGRTIVVLNELIMTFPDHKLLYNRLPGQLSPVFGLYFAHLEEEEE